MIECFKNSEYIFSAQHTVRMDPCYVGLLKIKVYSGCPLFEMYRSTLLNRATPESIKKQDDFTTTSAHLN